MGEAIWEAFEETIWARVIESQKMPRDGGESIFAARHQDVSQGPVGGDPQSVPKHYLPVVEVYALFFPAGVP